MKKLSILSVPFVLSLFSLVSSAHAQETTRILTCEFGPAISLGGGIGFGGLESVQVPFEITPDSSQSTAGVSIQRKSVLYQASFSHSIDDTNPHGAYSGSFFIRDTKGKREGLAMIDFVAGQDGTTSLGRGAVFKYEKRARRDNGFVIQCYVTN